MPSTLQKGLFCFARAWLEAHLQALNDIRTRWRNGGFWLLVVAWSGVLLLGLSKLSGVYETFGFVANRVACQPDGNFDLYTKDYHYWSMLGFFQITIGYGHLSFTQAKIIDIIWDIVCGRGGQAIIAFVSWNVFANYVTTSMEVAPVTFHTYRTVFLQNESLTVAIPRLIREFACRRGLHSRTAMVFMIATMIFILFFPTFASAMTGYSGNLKCFIPDEGNNYISFDGFRQLLYVIHDGWRIGKTGDYVITYDPIHEEPILDTDIPSVYHLNNGCNSDAQSPEVQERCRIQPSVTDYVLKYGFWGLENSTSTFLNSTLKPPVLNISAFYLDSDWHGASWTDPRTQLQPFKNESRRAWTYGNETYDMDYIVSRGTCQAVESYKWGFSFIQLNTVIILCICWTAGILTMWIQSHFTMKRQGRKSVAGEYKAVLELADALNSQFMHAREMGTQEILTLSESKLRLRIKKDLHGGLMTYKTPLLTSDDEGRGDVQKRFRSLLKAEAWWIIALLISWSTTFMAFHLFRYMIALIFLGLLVTLVLTVCIGSSGKSRGVLFLWLFSPLCLTPLFVFHFYTISSH